MNEPIAPIAPIAMEITVARDVRDAFRIFTEEIGTWWPSETHSIGEGRVVDVTIEGRVGGRCFETWDDGSEHVWGEVLRWDAPRGFTCTWHPSDERPTATELEVTFSPADGGTLVALEHRGWERHGPEAPELVKSYRSGWPVVLELYARRCEADVAHAG